MNTLHMSLHNFLNSQQQVAVFHKDGPLLVLAGAGSGKTKIVTHRIMQLIEEGVPFYHILGVTFTNKAAEEMQHRVKELTNKQVHISTFHSLGCRILRESIECLGYHSNFTIYDEDDSLKLVANCLSYLGLKDKDNPPKLFRQAISSAKSRLLLPEQAGDDQPKKGKEIAEVYNLYQARLKESNAVDFDDLLYLVVRLFKEHPEVLKKYQERWRYILIDEYQDTNYAQYLIVNFLVEQHRNLFVVGDPDQSIYSWRGANISNILSFEIDYPGAKVVQLEQNYRSTNTILKAANALISRNTQRYEKRLWSDKGDGDRIISRPHFDEREEADFIAQEISRLHRRGISLNSIVIFYRTNFQSRAFEDALLRERLPYTVFGGTSFYQRKEIKDILAYLRMADSGNDFISFARTVNLPKRGIGDTFLEKLLSLIYQSKKPILACLQDVINKEPYTLSVKANKKHIEGLTGYLNAIKYIQAGFVESGIKGAIKAAIHRTSYLQYLREDPETFDDRKENLDQLTAKAIEWQEEHVDKGLTEFLEELALKTNMENGEGIQEKVSLMTLHTSKGLEFDIVFLAGLEDDLLPHANSYGSTEQLEEERRLCYVGITRARKQLYLTHAQYRYVWGDYRMMRQSRFLKEIPLL